MDTNTIIDLSLDSIFSGIADNEKRHILYFLIIFSSISGLAQNSKNPLKQSYFKLSTSNGLIVSVMLAGRYLRGSVQPRSMFGKFDVYF